MIVEVSSITICLAYNPPNAPEDQFINLLDTLKGISEIENLIIFGDFNCPDIDWLTMSACSPSSDSLCDLCNLTQLVSSPTHSRGNTLDLVITNSEGLIEDLWIEDSNTHSDHFKIHFSVNTDYQYKDKRNSKYSFVYDYSKADYAGMCSFILDKDFSDCFTANNLIRCAMVLPQGYYTGGNY